ncbi:MAG: hypothetical protein BHW37_02620 [Firmicutes bacterium CAG:272_52_7]|nr:MAG: hypothetical protein BHW37_02620 [Firmicutes bacterium CAG:272_52_7]
MVLILSVLYSFLFGQPVLFVPLFILYSSFARQSITQARIKYQFSTVCEGEGFSGLRPDPLKELLERSSLRIFKNF